MADQVQISAHVSTDTKARIERFVREHGVKRSYLIEQALQHYLAALEEVSADAIIPTRLVVSKASAKRIVELIESPPEPTEAMKALFDESR